MTDPRSIQDRIVDPDPFVEEVLQSIDARVNHTIYGPDGHTPLLEPMIDDRTLTYSKDGQSYSATVAEFYYRVGRLARDGMSMDGIRAELDLPQRLVSDGVLSDAIKVSVQLLESAIRDGVEPEESKRVIGYRDPNEGDTTSEETTEDALALGRRVVEGWKR